MRIDYTTKEALNQHPDEDKLFIFGDTLISENELFGEASLLMDDLNDRLIIEIEDDEGDEQEQERQETFRLGKRASRNNQNGSAESHSAQKRYRTLTHVI